MVPSLRFSFAAICAYYIDSFNGDSGCEVMAVPGIICNERTHLVCIAFSPLDWLEQKVFA